MLITDSKPVQQEDPATERWRSAMMAEKTPLPDAVVPCSELATCRGLPWFSLSTTSGRCIILVIDAAPYRKVLIVGEAG